MHPNWKFVGFAAASTLVVATLAHAAAEDTRKPKPPYTGAPAWQQPVNDANRIKAVHLYVHAAKEVELARADLEEAAKLGQKKTAKSDKAAQAKLASAERRLRVARAEFDQVVALDPASADGWNQIGDLRVHDGDRSGALAAYDKCLEISPNHFAARESRAEAYLAEGRIEQARAELEWLRGKGNMTTRETTTLSTAIERWVVENSQPGTTATAPSAGPASTSTEATADSTKR